MIKKKQQQQTFVLSYLYGINFFFLGERGEKSTLLLGAWGTLLVNQSSSSLIVSDTTTLCRTLGGNHWQVWLLHVGTLIRSKSTYHIGCLTPDLILGCTHPHCQKG